MPDILKNHCYYFQKHTNFLPFIEDQNKKHFASIDEKDKSLREEIIKINKTIEVGSLTDITIKKKFEAMQKGIPQTFGGRKYKKSRKNSRKISNKKSSKKIRKFRRKTAKKYRR